MCFVLPNRRINVTVKLGPTWLKMAVVLLQSKLDIPRRLHAAKHSGWQGFCRQHRT